MSELEKRSVQSGAASGTRSPGRWWGRVWNVGGLRALRGLAGARRRRVPDIFRSGIWMVILWIVLLCLPIGGVILGYIRRPAPGTVSISAGSAPFESAPGDKIPKPDPGKPMLPVSQAPPPTVSLPAPSPITPEAPPPITPPATPLPKSAPAPVPAPAPPAAPAARPAFAAISYPARHDKFFGGECSGQLTLNSSGLLFSCPGNTDDGINVAVNQIDAVDDNGIRLLSGKKYHFSIPGMSKSGVRAMFADWLNRVR
jgi:hypothetical protein